MSTKDAPSMTAVANHNGDKLKEDDINNIKRHFSGQLRCRPSFIKDINNTIDQTGDGESTPELTAEMTPDSSIRTSEMTAEELNTEDMNMNMNDSRNGGYPKEFSTTRTTKARSGRGGEEYAEGTISDHPDCISVVEGCIRPKCIENIEKKP